MRSEFGQEWAKLPQKSAQDATFVALNGVRTKISAAFLVEASNARHTVSV